MIFGTSIILSGYPERVQRVADALDGAFPDLIKWLEFAAPCGTEAITLEGRGVAKHEDKMFEQCSKTRHLQSMAAT